VAAPVPSNEVPRRLELGSYAWTKATGGRLSRAERARLVGQALALQLRVLPKQLRARLGLGGARLAGVDARTLEAPDTAAAREAEELLAGTGDDALVGHSQRTFAWARILAAHDRLDHDAELLYVAALVHDLGLAAPYRVEQPPAPCFTLRSADIAADIGRRHGWGAARAELAADAITRHMNLAVERAAAAEARLLIAGAQLDAIGMRHWDLSEAAVAAVLGRYPRRGTKAALIRLFAHDAALSPGTRSALYNRRLGGARTIRGAPFAE
jgi:hypothetical protein